MCDALVMRECAAGHRTSYNKTSEHYIGGLKNETMMKTEMQVDLDLMSFVETNILPRYNAFGTSHGLAHVQRVIANSLVLARRMNADINMCYAIAAYHDLGMSGPRAIYHITGGKILMADKRLTKWFSPQQLRVMKEAVEDHRASASHSPRSIYGKIVAEADRDLDRDTVFRRAVEFGLENYPEKSREQQWQRFYAHMKEKYSSAGYITLWIPNSPNEQKLKEIRGIIEQPQLLRQYFERFYQQATTNRDDSGN